MRFALLAFFVASVLPLHAAAHATGVSIEREVNGYFIDIGYDTDPIVAGSPVRFDFALYSGDGSGSVEFDRVWLRVEDEDRTVFAGGIARPQFGATGAILILPQGGTYTFFARFEEGGEEVVEIEVPIEARAPEGAFMISWWIALSAAAATALTGFFLGRRSRTV